MTPVNVYAQRRARLAASLGPDALAIIPTAPVRLRNRDSEYSYRGDSYFLYLTGFEEPNACLLIDHQGRSTLLCQPRNEEREIWDGIRLGPERAPAVLGVDAAISIEQLDDQIPLLLSNQQTVWWPFATHEGLAQRVEQWLNAVRQKARQGVRCPNQQRDLCALIDEMRLVKDDHELENMRRAAQISAQAHLRAMRACVQTLKQGQPCHEYLLEAELLHEFRRHGSSGPAYGNIVAAGANACILHYRADQTRIQSGDLVLIDAGCELHGYASDITRTFPANGQFTNAQRAVYDLVCSAQEAAVQATRAGARFNEPHDAAVRVLSQGLLDLGLLNQQTHGSVEDVIANKHYSRFYMHRTSHWLGLDVHDCGAYSEPNEEPPNNSRILRPGMVLTLEPGLYIRPAADVPEPYWNIGIRIEDDAVVQPHGCELITRDVPVNARDIEAWMALA
jgi:Xaa-Pro aminopeptidase